MNARERYLSFFTDPSAARRFELSCLAGPPELLPPAAQRAKKRMPKDEAYWKWLVEQVHQGGER